MLLHFKEKGIQAWESFVVLWLWRENDYQSYCVVANLYFKIRD